MVKNKTKKIASKAPVKIRPPQLKKIKIRVIGLGGGGSSIVSELASRMKRISFVVADTDSRALRVASKKTLHFQFGMELTKGLGTGMNPELGREAAIADKEKIKKLLTGYDFCVIVTSLGGGVGSGAVPIFSKISKELGNVTYGIFTLPFKFEGEKKMEIARQSLSKLKSKVDIFSVIPNERIFQIIDKKTPLKSALSIINNSLAEGLEGLIDMIYTPGLINIDFADFKTILSDQTVSRRRTSGKLAYLNTVAISHKKDNTKDLIEKILYNPLYPYTINGANGILLNIGGEKDLTLTEVNRVLKTISGLSNKEAKIIFGIAQDKKYSGVIKTTLMAVGCKNKMFPSARTPRALVKKNKVLPIISPESKSEEKEVEKPIQKKIVVKIKKNPKKKKNIEKNKKINIPSKKKETPIQKSRIKIPVIVKQIEDVKVRKNALQIRKEMEEEEKEILEKEKFWETPAFLRRK
ncbi:MAG: cell division protein FtsZ [Patescibacteria group bacterium]|nr:cell division FtsZ family protein [Patescibacteria group bacterium]MBU1877071.1 cell division FtsZ family protein [Patescibacteria group bacterium]